MEENARTLFAQCTLSSLVPSCIWENFWWLFISIKNFSQTSEEAHPPTHWHLHCTVLIYLILNPHNILNVFEKFRNWSPHIAKITTKRQKDNCRSRCITILWRFTIQRNAKSSYKKYSQVGKKFSLTMANSCFRWLRYKMPQRLPYMDIHILYKLQIVSSAGPDMASEVKS